MSSDESPREEAAPAPARGEEIDQAGERRSARVESLRGLGALSIAWFHVFAVTTGVALIQEGAAGHESLWQRGLTAGAQCGFFLLIAISGCLLFWPFAKRHWSGGEHINLRRYATNRALRILPLYYVVVVVLLLIQEGGGARYQWLRFGTFTQNFFHITVGTVDTPMWSIAVELQFYVLLPILAWAVARASGASLRRAAAWLLAVGALSIAVRYAKYLLVAHPDPVWHFSLPATFWFFVPGMLVSLVRVAWQRERPAWLAGPLGRSDLWLAGAIPIWALIALDHRLDPLGGVAAFLIIGACILPLRQGAVVDALGWRPLATIGIASYSLYLWHAPLLRLLKQVDWMPHTFLGLSAVAMPLAVLVALVSYRLVEAPFLGLRRQWARSSARQRRPPVAATAPPQRVPAPEAAEP